MPLPDSLEIVVQDALVERDQGFPVDTYVLHPRDATPDSRESSRCHNLTSTEQIEKLPHWDTILKAMDERYGAGDRNILVYDKHYPEVLPAKVCVPASAIPVQVFGVPTCRTINITTGGMITGTHGVVSVNGETGMESSDAVSITEAASFSDLGNFRARFKYPDGVQIRRASRSFYMNFVNVQSQSFEVTHQNKVNTIYNITVQEGQSCQAMEAVQACTFQGTGRIPFIASGIIWAEYIDLTYDHREHTKHHSKHYKYKINITEVLPDDAQRTMYATFKGSFSTTTRGQYKAVCTGGETDDDD
ncbi:hypothetical protein C8R42DRAFT_360932 [Lentinula raphanica]|nr:hypothetical protein C8R42DRAFT_360932 [Lentinula raphanica]